MTFHLPRGACWSRDSRALVPGGLIIRSLILPTPQGCMYSGATPCYDRFCVEAQTDWPVPSSAVTRSQLTTKTSNNTHGRRKGLLYLIVLLFRTSKPPIGPYICLACTSTLLAECVSLLSGYAKSPGPHAGVNILLHSTYCYTTNAAAAHDKIADYRPRCSPRPEQPLPTDVFPCFVEFPPACPLAS